MATMSISLPDSMKEFIEAQAAKKGFGTLTLPTAKAGGFSVRRQLPGGAGACTGSLSV